MEEPKVPEGHILAVNPAIEYGREHGFGRESSIPTREEQEKYLKELCEKASSLQEEKEKVCKEKSEVQSQLDRLESELGNLDDKVFGAVQKYADCTALRIKDHRLSHNDPDEQLALDIKYAEEDLAQAENELSNAHERLSRTKARLEEVEVCGRC